MDAKIEQRRVLLSSQTERFRSGEEQVKTIDPEGVYYLKGFEYFNIPVRKRTPYAFRRSWRASGDTFWEEVPYGEYYQASCKNIQPYRGDEIPSLAKEIKAEEDELIGRWVTFATDYTRLTQICNFWKGKV